MYKSDISQIQKYNWSKTLREVVIDTMIDQKVVDFLKLNTQSKVDIYFITEQQEYMKQLSDFGFNIWMKEGN